MADQTIAVYGLGVMGQNIALNFHRNDANVVLFNRTKQKISDFLDGPGRDTNIRGTFTIEELVAALPRPRKILLMIQAGPATDTVLRELSAKLEPGDILIDGGNSWFRDSDRRLADLAARQIRFLGMGISGGEEGALKGPSMMPGGDHSAYQELEPLFRRAAAQTEDGPCVAYVGSGGAGHLVKMVHNGIEYGDMQLIAEAYDILREIAGLDPRQIRDTFESWNRTELQSFLIEITARIVDFPDDRGDGLLLDKIRDSAGQKGTGRWTVQLSAELASPVPTIAAAVDARSISSLVDERSAAARKYRKTLRKSARPSQQLIDNVRDALLASKICSYAQGMALLNAAGRECRYDLNLSEVARIWQGGCIIRAGFLKDISAAFRDNPQLPNLLLDNHFAQQIRHCISGWRATVKLATSSGLPAPAISASLAYFDSYRRQRLPAYLIQAQRDFFGAHTYQRTDQDGIFHTTWPEMID